MGKQQLQSNKENGNTLYNSDVAWGEETIQDSSLGQEWESTEVSVCETEQIFRRETGCGREISSGSNFTSTQGRNLDGREDAEGRGEIRPIQERLRW